MEQQDLQNLWNKTQLLRGVLSQSDYKLMVLGLLFLKFISASFEKKYQDLLEEGDGFEEDIDAYLAENIFYIPENARWEYIRNNAHQPDIGILLDQAMRTIEKDNPDLQGIMPAVYGRAEVDKTALGDLIDLLSFSEMDHSSDILGKAYEFFLREFGELEGRFYTPTSLVQLLVQLIEPFSGRIYDPCFGSGGMFVQSAQFVTEHQGRFHDISVYGQEIDATTWKLAKMNLSIKRIPCNFGDGPADTLLNDLHKDLKADFILANPPFGTPNWGAEEVADDVRWKYGLPLNSNANYAWIQHIISKLSPQGKAALIVSNGCGQEDRQPSCDIRRKILEDGLVDCVIALPGRLFTNTNVNCNVWILSKHFQKEPHPILFINAMSLSKPINVHQEYLPEEAIQKISDTFHRWKSGKNYQDQLDFCRSVEMEEISKKSYYLQVTRYIESSDNRTVSLEQICRNYQESIPQIVQSQDVLISALEACCHNIAVRSDLNQKLTIQDIADTVPVVVPGKAILTQEDGVYYIKSTAFSDGFINKNELEYIRKDFVKPHKLEKYLAKENDIVFSSRGTGNSIGKLAIVTEDVLPAVYHQNVFVLRRKNENVSLGYLYLCAQLATSRIRAMLSGVTNLTGIQSKDIWEFPIHFPTEEMCRIADALWEEKHSLQIQKQNLEKLEQSLFQYIVPED